MYFKELIREDKNFREEVNYKNRIIANQILAEYQKNKRKDNISYPRTNDRLSDLISTYFLVKGTENQMVLEAMMKKYAFDYSASVRNAIIYLFGRESETGKSNPLNRYSGSR